jgi:hypothetical protein
LRFQASMLALRQSSGLAVGWIALLLIQPRLTAAPTALADVAVVLGLGLICFVPFGPFVRGVVAGGWNH